MECTKIKRAALLYPADLDAVELGVGPQVFAIFCYHVFCVCMHGLV